MLRSILLGALFSGSIAPLGSQQPGASPSRPYRISDGALMEKIKTGSITFAPDGQAVALVRLRPTNSQIVNAMVIGETRADIWLQEARGEPLRNLTSGQADSSGWWLPKWSPDGQRLAMLSSRGGTVKLWVWERATNQRRQLSSEGVDFSEAGGYRWVDSNRLVALLMPEGEPATPFGDFGYTPGRYAELALGAWSRAMRGEVTASSLNSLEFRFRQRRLLLLDVQSGAGQVIGTTQIESSGSQNANWWVSPDGRAVAFSRSVPGKYPISQRGMLGFPASLDLRWLDGRPLQLDRPLPSNIVTSSLHWSPDGKSLAFFALDDTPINPLLLYAEGASEVVTSPAERAAPLLKHPARLWRVHLERGQVTSWKLGDIEVDPRPDALAAWVNPDRRIGERRNPLELPVFQWTTSGELLFRARRPAKDNTEWVVLGTNGRTRAGAPHLESGFAANSLATAARQRFQQVVKPPTPGAEVVAFSQSQTNPSAIYAQTSRQGTFLWRVAANGSSQMLAEVNTFLKDVVVGEPKVIEYTTLNGERMKAYVLLPPGYTPGRRYPLVVDSDIGYESQVIEGMFDRAKSGSAGYIDGQDFAAGGYVYMFTSMPTISTMDPVGRSNLLLLTHGILPAVDKAIALGFADPDRLFLYGGSSMGYGVYGLVTQTPRFKAAVAQSGWTDQITHNLLGSELSRYADWRFDNVYMGALYSRFRLPFWRNADHYRRNSPLSYVDRVRTPLMIVHGDLDLLPMADPEMFFAALIQQRKPAQFVRYWGEGHGIQNPKNYADFHQRMFAWFDDWGDVSRDAEGRMIFEGDRVKSRDGKPALRPADYARFEPFWPAARRATTRALH